MSGNNDRCLYNKPNACRFFVYLFPTFVCDDLWVINDVWRRGEKKGQLNKMAHFFYFALQHCKWHRWQCLVTYQYISSELFLPATSKRHIFLHKYKDALPFISELQGQLQAFVSVSWDLIVSEIILRHSICLRVPTSPCLFQKDYSIRIKLPRILRSLLSGSCRCQDYDGLLKNKSQPYHI